MNRIWRIGLVVMVAAAGAVLAGCGERYEQQPVLVGVPLPMTTDDVVAAVKAGESEDAIVSKLQRSGSSGALTTKDVDRLREEGVSEGVIDWMLANPGPALMPSAPIVRTVEGVPVREVVYVERAPDVVVVERPPTVTYSIGVGYYYGHHRYYGPRYHYGYRYHHYPRTRVYRRGDRTYRYTSGH